MDYIIINATSTLVPESDATPKKMTDNHPTFTVYVDPFAKYSNDNPPDAASMLVQRLVNLGFNPMVDARGQPSRSEVCVYHGLVLLQSGEFVACGDYDGSSVLCVQTYAQPVPAEQLPYIIARVAKPFYNIDGDFRYDPTVDYTSLAACVAPQPQQTQVEYSDFLGNTIRMYDDRVFVVDPAAALNPLKRSDVTA